MPWSYWMLRPRTILGASHRCRPCHCHSPSTPSRPRNKFAFDKPLRPENHLSSASLRDPCASAAQAQARGQRARLMAASHSPCQARLLIVIWTGIRCLRGLHSILWALSLIALNCRLVGSPPRVPVAQAYRWRGPHDRSAATLTAYRHNRAKPIHLARADANRASQLAIGVVEFSRYGGAGANRRVWRVRHVFHSCVGIDGRRDSEHERARRTQQCRRAYRTRK